MSTSDYASAPDHDRRDKRSTNAPPGERAGELAALQHAAGNQAVSALIQAKLQVGAVDDPLEREADRVAKQVVAGAHRHEGPACADCSPAASAAAPSGDPAVRRAGAGSGAGGELDTGSDAAIRQASGRGRGLEPDVQRAMEAGFGADFSGVSIHVDAAADELNRQLGARAFTAGSDIFFRQGEYAPDSPGGKELLAHELTHVVQQGAAGDADAPSGAMTTVRRKAYRIGTSEELLEVGYFTPKEERERLLEEAEQIMTVIRDTYRITLDSQTTLQAIREDYSKTKEKVRNSLSTRAWRIKELRALRTALGHYATILGAERAQSTRSGDPQEVEIVGKVSSGINENTKAGKLDLRDLGEYFAAKKSIGLFRSAEWSTGVFSDVKDQLTGTFVHELAHGLLEYTLPAFIRETGYWKRRTVELSEAARVESPITSYGKKNAEEDLCESAMVYFLEPERLRKKCPRRFKFMADVGTGWLPAPVDAPQIQPEATGTEPKGVSDPLDTPPPPELEQALDNVIDVVQQVERRPDDATEEKPGSEGGPGGTDDDKSVLSSSTATPLG